ncbi:MAG: phosphoribosylglycinamide formyltransferase [Planctomycetaceae bacterium]|nr:phosphoribosylglycinamide formyltransferase [Planctomycetaceae bacterium]
MSLDRPVRLAVLISGGGTTLVNFLDAIAAGRLQAEIPLVIASRRDCGGIAKAERAGIRCVVLPRKESPSLEAFSDEIFRQCRESNVDLVALAGFLSLIRIPVDFLGRVMNIHPSLIPAFCGHGFHGHTVHESALARGVKVSGCTVHFADNEYDHGPIIVQRCVPVLPEDSADLLAARVFEAECQAYPEAIELYRQGRLRIAGSIVQILPLPVSQR